MSASPRYAPVTQLHRVLVLPTCYSDGSDTNYCQEGLAEIPLFLYRALYWGEMAR